MIGRIAVEINDWLFQDTFDLKSDTYLRENKKMRFIKSAGEFNNGKYFLMRRIYNYINWNHV